MTVRWCFIPGHPKDPFEGECPQCRIEQDPSRYCGSLGTRYVDPTHSSFCRIEVLPFLKGRPWDQAALNVVDSLRPSFIRVTAGEEKSDGRGWRVTVRISKDGIIQDVSQECVVGLRGGLQNGTDVAEYIGARHTWPHAGFT